MKKSREKLKKTLVLTIFLLLAKFNALKMILFSDFGASTSAVPADFPASASPKL